MSGLTAELAERRLRDPHAFASRIRDRVPASWAPDQPLMLIAADHPARGSLRVGGDPIAMGDREVLLERCLTALSRPGVNGFVGTSDLMVDLANLGALDGKVCFGSMNRGGLAGSSFELDDRFTGYDVGGIVDDNLAGGKMLLRYDLSDPGTSSTVDACAEAVTGLARRGRIALVEPFLCHRDRTGRLVNDLSTDAVVTSVAMASGLGASSAWTWLKLPAITDMATVARATTMPILLLGGDAPADPDAARRLWAQALAPRNVRGVVFGRAVLYPRDGDVASAVDSVVHLLEENHD